MFGMFIIALLNYLKKRNRPPWSKETVYFLTTFSESRRP
ncbi:hypothetical protein ACFTAO_38635 [Paenibacillus rhizoplanae]